MIARAAALAAVAVVLVPPAGAGTTRPLVALTASPPHLRFTAAGRQAIRVVNSGAGPVVVDASPAGFGLDARGRPKVVAATGSWLQVAPSTIALAPGESTLVSVASTPPRGAGPGDHPALVLLTTRPRPGAAVAVRMRIGIGVMVRVPGRVVHRLDLRALHARDAAGGRVLRLVIANRGNVVERLRGGGVEIDLVARGRLLARLHPRRREILPRSSAAFELRYRGRAHGWITARVRVANAAGTVRRTFRVRL